MTQTRRPIKTTCPYCGVGCGIVASFDGQDWAVGGDPDHPANKGRLCSKGSVLAETIGGENRLLSPVVDGTEATWDQAISAVSDRLAAVIKTHGPGAVALYGSGQLLTEDYYVANKLMKGFIGSPHMDTNSRLCMSSTVAGHKRAFGSDTVPGIYEDLEDADLVVLTGSNLAWCHPVLYQRLVAARQKRGTRVVVIDPRRTDSCDSADLHLALKPGTDTALFNGLLAHLQKTGRVDQDYLVRHVLDHQETMAHVTATASDPEALARTLDIPATDLLTFFDLFARTEKVVTVFSQGVNQSVNGTDKVNAIINCHIATGRIGKPGMGPFSVTGQPNAMGGREVGGLANILAAHMDYEPHFVDIVRRFWQAPNMVDAPGMKAMDMFRAMDRGEIKAVWIMATNPAVSLPEGDLVRRALSKCPVVIISDAIDGTDTARFAHIKLPAAGWSEKDGTVTNSERTISRQRAFRPAMGHARPDWWIMSQVGQTLGQDFNWPTRAFDYTTPRDIFVEHAALSAFENDGQRDFDIGALASLTVREYDAMAPVRWPYPKGGAPSERLFGDGKYFTSSRKARMIAVEAGGLPESRTSDYPFILNTGRYRDQWHTMTRTELAPRLNRHRPEPLIEIHPDDANTLDLKAGDIAQVTSRMGTYMARVRLEDAQRPGEVFLPMHWSDAFAGNAVLGKLIPGHTDPFSGQPASKAIPVSIAPLQPNWQGVLITNRPLKIPGLDYRVMRRADGCYITEVADRTPVNSSAIMPLLDNLVRGERLEYQDQKRGQSRFAWVVENRVAACLFAGATRPRIDLGWLEEVAAAEDIDPVDRAMLLAGRAPMGREDSGPVICACHQVGLNKIISAIQHQKLGSVDAIGAALGAGTNCRSCVPELRRILTGQTAPSAEAAE